MVNHTVFSNGTVTKEKQTRTDTVSACLCSAYITIKQNAASFIIGPGLYAYRSQHVYTRPAKIMGQLAQLGAAPGASSALPIVQVLRSGASLASNPLVPCGLFP